LSDFAHKSATALVEDIKAGRISSFELLELYLQRIERLNPDLNAVVHINEEEAGNRAKKADDALARGESWGPLHGLPMTVKDTIEVEGMPCTSGAPELKAHMPHRHADVVKSLTDAGAVVFGKTNVPLYGGDMQSYNAVYGKSSNPWNPEKTPGGSSGGAAAALAAGFSGLELGSDIGGSIRVPAHFCGIYGHKPSFGIVPTRGHIPPPPGIFTGDHSMTVDIMVVGPLARSIDDISMAMDLLVAPAKPEQRAWRISLPEPRKKSLKAYKLGLWLDDPNCPVDKGVGDVLQKVADDLIKKGANIYEKKPDIDFAGNHEIFHSLLAAVMASGFPEKQFKQWLSEAKELTFADQSYSAKNIRALPSFTGAGYGWML
jgi:amidase